jgi:putative ABC transport system ATP-binding protein
MSALAPVVALRGVERVYGKGDAIVHALAGVDFEIRDGEFVAVMGASGSGKSTCMNILGCLDVPTGGEYLFRGVDVGSLDADQLALLRRNYLGFVFQGFNLLKRTSALQNVELPLIYRRVPRRERRERAREALRSVGLSDRESHTPSELSGGQQQRVAIARAIVSQPLMLLADEPTGNLDQARKHDILELLVKLNQERHITIVMVTHEPEMVEYASRVIEFRDGRVVQDASVPQRNRGTDAA